MTSKPEISMHALIDSLNPRTIRVKGKVASQWVLILVDSGNTYNFLDSTMDKRAKLPICAKEKVRGK